MQINAENRFDKKQSESYLNNHTNIVSIFNFPQVATFLRGH